MKKLMILFFMTILLVGTISAFEFDNRKTYDESTKTATLSNSFLGFTTSEITQVTLDTPQNYEVGEGYQLVAQMTFNPKDDYSDIIKSLSLYNLKNGNEITRKIDIKYKTFVNAPVNDYKSDCTITKGEPICYTFVSGSHLEYQETWLPFDGNIKTSEPITIGLFTNVEIGDRVEWIPNIAGVDINEWATWTGALNVGLKSYWKLNEVSGSVGLNEINSSLNFNTVNSPSWITGKLGNSLFFNGTTNYAYTNMKVANQTTGNWSLSFWGLLNNTNGGATQTWFGWTDSGGFAQQIVNTNSAEQAISTRPCQSDETCNNGASIGIPLNTYFHYVVVANGTDYTVYVNGTKRDVFAYDGTYFQAQNNYSIGARWRTSANQFLNGSMDEIGIWNRSLSSAEVTQLYNSGTGITYQSSFPESRLIAPENNSNVSDSITFSVIPISTSVTTGINVSIYGNWSGAWHLEVSNTSSLNNTQTNFTVSAIPSGKYVWNAYVVDGSGTNTFNESNYTFTMSVTAPLVFLNTPENSTNSTNSTAFFNTTITDVGAGVNNVTLYIDDLIYNSNSSGYNGTYLFNQSLPFGFHNWSVRANSSSAGNINGTRVFTLNHSYVREFNYNLTTYETAEERFYVNVTTNGSTPTANFTFNGTTYSAVVTNTANNDFNLSSLIQIPLGGENINKTFYFSYTLNGVGYNTPTRGQNVSELVFTNSNSTYSNDFLNISYKDEVTLVTINASIPSATFVYYLGNGTINKTYSYVNSTNQFNHTFSGYPTNRNINVLPVVQYKQGTDYPQRIWQPTLKIYNSIVYNQILYLLSSTDGIYVTFQMINSADQTIGGVSANATKTSDGTLINAGTTDDAGLITFFLNPDIEQTFCFSKSGYTTQCTTLFPTQSAYTITMSSTTSTSSDYGKGIIKTISPSTDFLDRYGIYSFNYTLNSSFWTVQKFEFRLYYSNGTLIISNSSTNSGGTISYNSFNVSNTSSVSMYYSYIINDSAQNFTRQWAVQSTEGRAYSIWNFFTDLTLYIDSSNGLWGIDDFSKSLLSVLLIILTVGMVGSRYGINNEATIMAILFGVVFFLDVSLGFIPRISFDTPLGTMTAFQNFPTILTFIILFALVIREERR